MVLKKRGDPDHHGRPPRFTPACAAAPTYPPAGDPQYQLVAQAYPFVVRKVLRNEGSGSGLLLRQMLYDPSGTVKPTRLSALLNAGLVSLSCFARRCRRVVG